MAEDSFQNFVSLKPQKKPLDFLKQTTSKQVLRKQPKLDSRTLEYYRVCRQRCLDPVTLVQLKSEECFKFKWAWDPITGERTHEDPLGPLCFDPDQLIRYFYLNRLNNLWVERDNGYAAHYDYGVGAGENFYLQSRGFHPERYLFRLPIIDCYLYENHNEQIVTMGPKLTFEEIEEIYNLARLREKNYQLVFKQSRPNIVAMYKIYHTAISDSPDVTAEFAKQQQDAAGQDAPEQDVQEIMNLKNRKAVDHLRKYF